MAFTADELFTIVRQMGASDIKELGPTSTAQNTFLVPYANRALRELANLAYRVRVSDPLTITVDGYQTFQRNSAAITDLYAPLRILNTSNQETQKRTSFSSPSGWWREADTHLIHTRALTGSHTMYYVGYPTLITVVGDSVDFPEAGVMGLAFWICGIVKESSNGYEESAAMYTRARERLKIAVQANIDARGLSSGGYVPSLNIVDTVFKG